MRTAHVNEIEVEVSGRSEPLQLVQGSSLAAGLAPLTAALTVEAPPPAARALLPERDAGSGGRGWPISVQEQAADGLSLLDALGVACAHLLGYFYGAGIALPAPGPLSRKVGSSCISASPSASGELFCGGSAGVGCAAHEAGEELKILVFVVCADLVHRGVHPGVHEVEAEHLRAPAAGRLDHDAAAVRRVAAAVDPASAFEPVQDAGHGRRVQPGAPRQGARAERAVPGDEVKALQVGVLEIEARADAVVEQGQLGAQVTQ
jgi:hypothetical protein